MAANFKGFLDLKIVGELLFVFICHGCYHFRFRGDRCLAILFVLNYVGMMPVAGGCSPLMLFTTGCYGANCLADVFGSCSMSRVRPLA